MNGQNNNTNGKVKSKFFNQDLFDDAKISDVGGSSTGGQVISWGVGGNRNNVPDTNSSTNKVSDLSVLDSTQMFNFVNTEVTDFEENNSYSNDINVSTNNNYGMQDESTGLFNGQQFAQSMDGQASIDNSIVQDQTGFITNVNDVFAEARFDGSAVSNDVSNEFAQSNPTFYGYNANPDVVAPNVENTQMPVSFDNAQVMTQQGDMTQMYAQDSNGVSQPVLDNQTLTMNNNQMMPDNSVQPVLESTIVAPAFDPFNSMAEPVQPFVQENTNVSMQSTDMISPDLQMQQNSPLFAIAAETEVQQPAPTSFEDKNLQPLNISANDGEINDDMRSNQPLSLMALSGETIDEEQKPKDVLENNKYFQNTPLEDNRLKIEEVVAAPVAPVVDLIAEPTRDVNIKELVKAFVGPKYTKISMSPFSFCGGFFGTLYFFYRKMFVHGLVLALVSFVINLITAKNGIIGLGLCLAYFIIVGLLTNSLYLSFATNKVKKLVALNPKLNQYELQKLASKQGGTGFWVAFLLNMVIGTVTTNLVNGIVGTNAILEMLNTGSSQDVVQKQENVDVNTLIDITLPSEFVLMEDKELDYYIIEKYSKRGEEVEVESCGFKISIPLNQSDSEKLIENMANADNRYNRVSTYKTENKEIWDVYSYEGSDRTYIYRAKEFDGHVILISYTIHDKATEGMCETHLENIMNSIKEK